SLNVLFIFAYNTPHHYSSTPSLHDALPISIRGVRNHAWRSETNVQPTRSTHRSRRRRTHQIRIDQNRVTVGRATAPVRGTGRLKDRKSTSLNSSHVEISYAVFCLKKKINNLEDSPDRATPSIHIYRLGRTTCYPAKTGTKRDTHVLPPDRWRIS